MAHAGQSVKTILFCKYEYLPKFKFFAGVSAFIDQLSVRNEYLIHKVHARVQSQWVPTVW